MMRRHGLSRDGMNIEELSHHTVDGRPGCYRRLKEGGSIPHTLGGTRWSGLRVARGHEFREAVGSDVTAVNGKEMDDGDIVRLEPLNLPSSFAFLCLRWLITVVSAFSSTAGDNKH